MAGIYLHFPYCKTKCIYCDFYSKTDMRSLSDYIKAMCAELRLRRDYLQNEPVDTIYFGGGTPGLLACGDLNLVIEEINKQFSVSSNPEITLEVNPDDVTSDYVAELKSLPVNRISMGVQSFDAGELLFLQRRHSASQAIEAVKRCQRAGFKNTGIDLMYGLPGQTIETWKNTLEQAVRLNVAHISAYHLIYEENTEIYRKLKSGVITPCDEDASIEMFNELIDTLIREGFIHYEISAFAKSGYISKHNSSYWKNVNYLGIGASAHSYNKISRDRNISDTEKYIENILSGKSASETELIDKDTAYNDYIVTSLRTMWGISPEKIKAEFGTEKEKYCMTQARKYLNDNLLESDEQIVRLTRKGMFVSDGIMSDLLWVV